MNNQHRRHPAVTNAADLAASSAFANALKAAHQKAGRRIGTPEILAPLGDPNKAGIDGEDHILIDSERNAATMLGRALHNSSTVFPFTHSHAGRFPTVNNFWEWVRSESRGHDIRTAHPAALRNIVRNAQGKHRKFTPHFRYLVVDAIWQRIVKATYNGQKVLLEEFRRSELPFEMYQIHRTETGTLRERQAAAVWQVRGLEELRKLAKAGYEEPTLEPFMRENPKNALWALCDDEGDDLYIAISTAPAVKKEVKPAADVRDDNPLSKVVELFGRKFNFGDRRVYRHFTDYPGVQLVQDLETKIWFFYAEETNQLFHGEKGATGLRPTILFVPDVPETPEVPEAPAEELPATTEVAVNETASTEVLEEEVSETMSFVRVDDQIYDSFEGFPALRLYQDAGGTHYFITVEGYDIYYAVFNDEEVPGLVPGALFTHAHVVKDVVEDSEV